MRLKIFKLFSKIVLVLLLLWFFIPEMHVLSVTVINTISSSCLFQQNCQMISITTPFQPDFDVLQKTNGNAEIIYVVNLPKESINLEESKVLVYQSNYSLLPTVNGVIKPFAQYVKLDEVSVKSDDVLVESVNSGVNIHFQNKLPPTEYMTNMYFLKLVDNYGNVHYNFSLGYDFPYYLLLLTRYSYLFQYLVWYFAIFGRTLFRKPSALVYDSKNKNPNSGVIVRIFKDNLLFKTVVTGTSGIVDVTLNPGKYRMEVFKSGYKFPSSLAPLNEDGEYKNLYYGKDFIVHKKSYRLMVNIPVDPENLEETHFFKKVGMFIVYTLDSVNEYFLGALIISQLIIWPTYIDSYVSLVVGGALLLLRFIIRRITRVKFGTVVDSRGNKMTGVELNLYDTQWDKLVATTSTDSNGVYQFLVPSADYYIKLTDRKNKLLDESDKVVERLEIAKDSSQKAMFINKQIKIKKNTV